MSKEDMNEVLAVNETASAQDLAKSDKQKKFSGKKWGIIGVIAVVVIALIAGISIYNTPANRLSRQLDLGNRYLEEQNYEQAIVEFDKAIAIDSMSVEAYLGKADAYIGMGDLKSALDTLQTGYELTGDERLKVKFDELNYIELPFSVSDIKIMGYDLLEPHFNELVEAFGIPMEQYEDGSTWGERESPYGVNTNNLYTMPTSYVESWLRAGTIEDDYYVYVEVIAESDNGVWGTVSLEHQNIDDINGGSRRRNLLYVTNMMNRNDIETVCDLPIFPEDTYDEWCEKMGVETMKSSVEGQSINEYVLWDKISESQKVLSGDGWYVNSYQEGVVTSGLTEGDTFAIIRLSNDVEVEFRITTYFDNGIIRAIYIENEYDDE